MRISARRFKAYDQGFLAADELMLIHSGKDYFDKMAALIQEAQIRIQLHTYIFEEDETGDFISKALIGAALRGVEVHVILDGFGSKNLSHKFLTAWRQAGIKCRMFSSISLFRNLHIGRRLHHKVLVVDGRRSLVGGINVANKYSGFDKEIPWLDFAMYTEGDVCSKLDQICYQIEARKFPLLKKENWDKLKQDSRRRVNIRQNDWFRNKKQIYFSYLHAIRRAERSVTIFGSYFLPGMLFRRALEKASARGVRIRIILAGKSDIPIFLNSSYYLYDWLHAHRIEVYEWQPSVLHAKLAIVDDVWMTVGSFNLNHLSAYGSIELNMDVQDENFVRRVRTSLDVLIEEGCTYIEPGRKKGLLKRCRELLAYFLGRSLIHIITFFPGFMIKNRKMID